MKIEGAYKTDLYLQYATLIPISVGCLMLSIENNQSFLLIFGIVVGVFILDSIIEEAILNPWIIKKISV